MNAVDTVRAQNERRKLLDDARTILQVASAEERDITEQEELCYDALIAKADKIEYVPVHQMVTLNDDRWLHSGDLRVLKPEERLSSLVGAAPDPFSMRKFLRGVISGDWKGADLERRAMSEGALTGGGYLMPEFWSANVIDLARNKARIFQAGAQTIPMPTSEVHLARQTADPTAQWHIENATIASSDLTFDQANLYARTLVALVKLSVELGEDAVNVDAVVEAALSKALAIQLDRAALRGKGLAPSRLAFATRKA